MGISGIWNYTAIDHKLLNSSPRDIRYWLSEFRTKVGQDKMAMVLTIMWAIWHNRNLAVFEGVRKDPQSTAHTALRYLVEYVAAQSGGRKGANAAGARWLPPVTGRFKVNVDGGEDLSVGFGTVVRDHEGQVIIAASKRHNGLFEPSHVEVMALRFAVKFARDLGLRAVDLEGEGDNLEVMAARSSFWFSASNSYGIDN